MVYYLPLITLVAVVAVISVILDRQWQARQAAKRSESTEEDKTGPAVTSRITEKFQTVRDRFGGRKQAKLAKQFQAWAAENITDNEGLKDWFDSLSQDGVTALTGQLSSFCSDLNLELSWLIEGQLDGDPDLKQAAENIVVGYCAACRKAYQVQDDLSALVTFEAYKRAPTSRKHREFVQQLYAKLAEDELISVPPVSEVFLAPQKQRLKQAAAAIQEATEKDRPAFNAVLKAVVAESSGASEAESSAEAQES